MIEVRLIFHDRTDAQFKARAEAAASRVPRCPACGHHPNTHVRVGCNVAQDKGKCGCNVVAFDSVPANRAAGAR